MKTEQPRLGGIMGVCMLPGKVLPRVCIARAAVNESVCEDLIVCKCRVSTFV